MAPPPKTKDSRRQNGLKEDLFGSIPFNPTPTLNIKSDFKDPFEMGEFGASTVPSNPSQQELENAIGLLDKRLLEMKVIYILSKKDEMREKYERYTVLIYFCCYACKKTRDVKFPGRFQ